MKRLSLFYFCICAIFISCQKESDPQLVKYTIGCSDCQVIYTVSGGQQVTEYNKNSDWSYSFSGKQGDVLMLFAYNTGGTPQGVTASIHLNDEILKEETRYCAISGYSFVVDTLE